MTLPCQVQVTFRPRRMNVREMQVGARAHVRGPVAVAGATCVVVRCGWEARRTSSGPSPGVPTETRESQKTATAAKREAWTITQL